MRHLLLLLLATCCPSAFSSIIIHDNDWETPFSSTYRTNFGRVATAPPTGEFDSTSLVFNTAGNSPSFYYDQINYAIGRVSNETQKFALSFDLLTDGLVGSTNQFAVLFGTPSTRPLYFMANGSIEVKPGWGAQRAIGSFIDGETLRLNILFDVGLNHWDITLNNTNLYSGYIDNTANPYLRPAETLRSIRFSHGVRSAGDDPDHGTNVYLDNVVITAVPQPSVLLLMLTSLLVLRRHREAAAG